MVKIIKIVIWICHKYLGIICYDSVWYQRLIVMIYFYLFKNFKNTNFVYEKNRFNKKNRN